MRPGITPKGPVPVNAAAALDAVKVPHDLKGKRVLDIGAWDGPYTFEMEKRGAKAVALDVQDPTRVGYAVARRVMGSKAPHYMGSVYQLPSSELSDLDLVLFCGVYYHLKYPLLAFECISAAMKIGATLHFEGEGFIDYAETLEGQPVRAPNLEAMAASSVPVCLAYPGKYKQGSNWHVPNQACLLGWLKASGFEVKEINKNIGPETQRFFGWAVKTSDVSAQLEHPLY